MFEDSLIDGVITLTRGERGAVTWTFNGTLAPGRSGMVTYRVNINE